MGTGDSQDGQELTSEECVRAGMYWFGRSDFAAADAWWQRALEIDPYNTRAQECLRLLSKSSSTGLPTSNDRLSPGPSRRRESEPPMTHDLGFAPEYSSENVAVLVPGEDGEPSEPMSAMSDDMPAMVLESSGDLTEYDPTRSENGSRDLPPTSDGPQGRGFPYYDDPEPRPSTDDPFDFAATSQQPRSPTPGPPGTYGSPWDEGPSRTSVVEVDAESGEYDAVPDPTPLPAIDRKRFFGRPEPETHEEIMDFLRATGDLPSPDRKVSSSPPAPVRTQEPETGILIDDPIEFEPRTELLDVSAAVERPDAFAAVDSSPEAILAEGRRRYQLHDFAGAIEVLDVMPAEAPQAEEARNVIASSRRNMLKMYESKIGDFDQVPRVLISNEEIIWLNLNHRAGFILSQIDGAVTYEDIISLSGMPRLDTVEILSQLLKDRVIGVD